MKNMRSVISAAAFIGLVALGGVVRAAPTYDDLIQAAESGDRATVDKLIGRGMDVNSVDKQGNTLLMLAARNGNLELIDLCWRGVPRWTAAAPSAIPRCRWQA